MNSVIQDLRASVSTDLNQVTQRIFSIGFIEARAREEATGGVGNPVVHAAFESIHLIGNEAYLITTVPSPDAMSISDYKSCGAIVRETGNLNSLLENADSLVAQW